MAAGRGVMGTVWAQIGCRMGTGSAVRTRKQPAGVCPAHRSQTGFGQSAGDFKPFLRHKGHGNKMPVRRRGSAVSRKRGWYTLVRNTHGASRAGLLHNQLFEGGKNVTSLQSDALSGPGFTRLPGSALGERVPESIPGWWKSHNPCQPEHRHPLSPG